MDPTGVHLGCRGRFFSLVAARFGATMNEMPKIEFDQLVFALIGGPVLMSMGMNSFKKRQLIANTPTSKVRSASMGLVELKGLAVPWKELQSPVTGTRCCWWRCRIEQRVQSGKTSRWQTLASRTSPLPLYLKDETGKVLIDPANAEVFGHIYQAKCTGSEPYFREMAVSMPSGGFVGSRWGFGPTLRVTEECIAQDSPLYAIGELGQRDVLMAERRLRYQERIRAAKKDPAAMRAADTNRDGVIDVSEWESYRSKLESEFILEEEKRAQGEEKVILRKPGNPDYAFILSTGGEGGVTKRYAWMAGTLIPLGIAASAYGVFQVLQMGLPTKTAALVWVGGTIAGFALAASLRGVLKRYMERIGVGR